MKIALVNLRKTPIHILTCLCIFSFAQARHSYNYLQNQNFLRQKAEASIVVVTGKDAKGQPVSPGNGFFVKDYLIATDYMVIKDAIQIYVQMAGQEAKNATLVAVDATRNVAILKVSDAMLPPLNFACPSKPSAGSKLYLPGTAGQADERAFQATVTKTRQSENKPYLQLNVAINNDKSGSPVLNQQGEVLGMVVRSAHGEQSSNRIIPAGYISSLLPSRQECKTDKPQNEVTSDDFPKSPVSGRRYYGIPPPAQIIRKSGSVLTSSAIRQAEPIHPLADVRGSVIVEVRIDEKGDVMSARPLSGHPLLKDTAAAAARGWKFTPAMLDGVPVKVVGIITFNFSL